MKDDVNIFRDNNVKFSENNLYYPTLCDIVFLRQYRIIRQEQILRKFGF